ncbi:hypothetical protein [Streptomyces fagopyri]|uniref:hypothetical protein n=1 Tax=Streptomyces fagopyri TaxID=2662397 RepID=UPI0033FABDAA
MVAVVVDAVGAAAVEEELALDTDPGRVAEVGEVVDLPAEHLAGCDFDGGAVVVVGVSEDEGGVEEIGEAAGGGEVGDGGEVAVSVVPAGEAEAVEGGHVGVGGEDVGAHLGSGLEACEEVGGVEGLALEAAHEVGDAEHDRGDVAGLDEFTEPVTGQRPARAGRGCEGGRVGHHSTSWARAAFCAGVPSGGTL